MMINGLQNGMVTPTLQTTITTNTNIETTTTHAHKNATVNTTTTQNGSTTRDQITKENLQIHPQIQEAPNHQMPKSLPEAEAQWLGMA